MSDAATGTFGFTTTRGAEQSAEVGGEGSKKDVWKVSGKFGAKWSEVEAEQTQRALQSIYSEVSTSTQSFTVTFTSIIVGPLLRNRSHQSVCALGTNA